MLTRAPLAALTAALAALPALAGDGGTLAIRVGRAETISDGTI